VRKLGHGASEIRPFEATPNLPELLGELNFSGYQELGFDKVLLVEGRTEIKTFQQFLRLWKKDHKIVMIPLGGADLINAVSEDELRELLRVSTHITAIIDSERAASGDSLDPQRQGFVESCERLGIDCHVLERRATENYLTDVAVKKVKGDSHRALGSYERLRDVSPVWGKNENWRIAREMTRDDIANTDLGMFIARL